MPAPHRLAAWMLLVAPLAAGCELSDVFGDIQNPRSSVQLLLTHHATSEEGAFPDRGGDGEMRVFTTDEGWNIQLVDALVVTSAATLHECDADSLDVDLFWGPVPEDLRDQDLDTFTLGAAEVGDAEFCGLTVHYGPYVPGDDAAPRSNQEIDGATVYLYGLATKGETSVRFEIRATDSVDVELDLATIDAGAPLRTQGDQAFPTDLTLAKTYDRFFDGIDFASATQADLDAHVLAVLALETRVMLGTRVEP